MGNTGKRGGGRKKGGEGRRGVSGGMGRGKK